MPRTVTAHSNWLLRSATCAFTSSIRYWNFALIDLETARERAKHGHRDSAIPVMRKSVDEVLTGGHLLYGISMAGVFAETLLDSSADGGRGRSRSDDRPAGGRTGRRVSYS